MIISTKIESIFNRLKRSEDEWKALYMATWNYADYVKKNYIDSNSISKTPMVVGLSSGTSMVVLTNSSSGSRNNKITLSLPASRKKVHEFNLSELHGILISRDGQFTIGHLQTLFSLFEEYLNVITVEVYGLKIDCSKFGGIKDFFKIKDFSSIVANTNVINELKLAKVTRNCYIHNGSKIDNCWCCAYKDARNQNLSNKIGCYLGEGFSDIFHQVEDWHAMIIEISESIMKVLESKS